MAEMHQAMQKSQTIRGTGTYGKQNIQESFHYRNHQYFHVYDSDDRFFSQQLHILQNDGGRGCESCRHQHGGSADTDHGHGQNSDDREPHSGDHRAGPAGAAHEFSRGPAAQEDRRGDTSDRALRPDGGGHGKCALHDDEKG